MEIELLKSLLEKLVFVFSDCLEERAQKKELFPGFMCSRCMVVCVLADKRSKEAAIVV